MVVKTIFRYGRRFEAGEVEISLLPGIPNLHIVGLPDQQIRECGIKLKAALRASGLKWPQGHQIVVNLRPSHSRKSCAGVDLAVALGFLSLTGQLAGDVKAKVESAIVYGEVALDGSVSAPFDASAVIRAAGRDRVLTGAGLSSTCDGEWLELEDLKRLEIVERRSELVWEERIRPPELVEISLPAAAVQPLLLALHMRLHVLLAGPQGSGKSTWARLLYSLTPPPDVAQWLELRDLFPEEIERLTWRPFEQPHHSATALAMVGGGVPVHPGVISRAHGGILLMDEFLEFNPLVLESLREPLETGFVEIARGGTRERLPADFQLIATTNLCPCGRLNPKNGRTCSYSNSYCRSVCDRLSGPLLDRFDLLILSHGWLEKCERVSNGEIRRRLKEITDFTKQRGPRGPESFDWVSDLELSYRRKRSLLQVARGLADLDFSENIQARHIGRANELVVKPMQEFDQFFA